MSSLSCRKGSELIGARRAGLDASERLRLEGHIAVCERCREDADRLDVVVALMDSLPERVTTDARRNELLERALSSEASSGRQRRRLLPSQPLRAALAIAAAGLLIVGGYELFRGGPPDGGLERNPDPQAQVLAGVAQADGQTLSKGHAIPAGQVVWTQAPASLQLGRARIATGEQTRLRWDTQHNTVALLAGRVTAQVAHRADTPFRVQTPTFTVEVTGTRFTVGEASVSVSEGSVRVIDRTGQVLAAALHAGERYTLEQYEDLDEPEETAAQAETTAAQADPPGLTREEPRDKATGPRKPSAKTDTPRPSRAAPAEPAPTAPQAANLLRQARASLAKRDIETARGLVKRAIAGEVSRKQRAEGETLLADCARSAGAHAEAARRYAQVAHRYRDLKAGENALYAAARAHLQLGHKDKAAALLQEYQRRHPQGMFRREVERELRVLQTP